MKLRAALAPVAGWLLTAAALVWLALGTFAPPAAEDLALEAAAVLVCAALHGAWAARNPSRPAVLLGPVALGFLSVVHADVVLPAARVAVYPLVGAALLAAAVALRAPGALVLPAALLAAVIARLAALWGETVPAPATHLAQELQARLPAARPAGQGPPVVVLTIDTLRADAAVQMDTWAALAPRGRAFPRALAASSWTVPSLSTLWTGAPAHVHGAGARTPNGGYTPLDPSLSTLPEELATAGYDTAAFVVNPFASRQLGIGRGFRTWFHADEHVPQRLPFSGRPDGPHAGDASRVVDHALAWLDGAPDGGWLLWVHLFDPHLPYRHLAPAHPARLIKHPKQIRNGALGDTTRLENAVRRAYLDEVDYADAEALRLVEALDARGFFTDGLFVFTSDHGEELWDHGGFEHGHSHHGEVTDVGLLLAAPGLAATPAASPGQVGLLDVANTLRAATGLPAQGPGLDLRGPIPAGRILTATGNLYGDPQSSARSTTARAIVDRPPEALSTTRRFDLRADPREMAPLPDDPADPVRNAALLTPVPEAKGPAADVNEERLRAIGYLD